MDLSQINTTTPSSPPRAVTTSGRWITNPEPSRPVPSSTRGTAPELRLATTLLAAATRMHDSSDPRAVLDVIAGEALRLLSADGVVVLVHDHHGPTPVLHLLSSGAEADPALTAQLWLQLAADHHLAPGRVTELDRHRLHRPEATGGGGPQPARWRSVLVADLDSPRSSRSAQLVWYAGDADAFTGDAELAALFARHAGLALRNVSERHHLLRAVESRTTTGQATGILMQRYHLTAPRAFEILRRFSQDRNLKLRDVAETITQTGELPT